MSTQSPHEPVPAVRRGGPRLFAFVCLLSLTLTELACSSREKVEIESDSSDKDISGIHFRLVGSDDVLQAYIVARAVRHETEAKPNVSALIARSKRMLDSSGATLTSEPEPIPDQDDPHAQAVPGTGLGLSTVLGSCSRAVARSRS